MYLGGCFMSAVDYMKVIKVLSKTLKMEKYDVHFPEESTNKLIVTMTGEEKEQKTFKLTVQGHAIELAFNKHYFSDRDFNRWCASFEYELEQAFVKNINVHVNIDVLNYTVKI